MKQFGILVCAAVLMVTPVWAGSITLGQVDDFQGGSLVGWTSGNPNPNPPTLISSGGPAGAGDAYMRVRGRGGSGPGGRAVAFNDDQWTGNFLGSGVTTITASVANFSADPLEPEIRISSTFGDFNTIDNPLLPADGQWREVSWDVTSGNWEGAGSIIQSLVSVFRLRIHDTRDFLQPPVTFGIDNIRATPEPASLLLLATGLIAIRRR